MTECKVQRSGSVPSHRHVASKPQFASPRNGDPTTSSLGESVEDKMKPKGEGRYRGYRREALGVQDMLEVGTCYFQVDKVSRSSCELLVGGPRPLWRAGWHHSLDQGESLCSVAQKSPLLYQERHPRKFIVALLIMDPKWKPPNVQSRMDICDIHRTLQKSN